MASSSDLTPVFPGGLALEPAAVERVGKPGTLGDCNGICGAAAVAGGLGDRFEAWEVALDGDDVVFDVDLGSEGDAEAVEFFVVLAAVPERDPLELGVLR